ncbi:MAG: hypothetical protein QM504_03930 [Pseudomonadota bacterium]
MQLLVLFCSFAFWIYALLTPELGLLGFLLWFVAFIVIRLTWSNYYAFLSLIAASSYHLSDWDHLNPFYSKAFPFICGMTTFILFFAFLFKLLAALPRGGGHAVVVAAQILAVLISEVAVMEEVVVSKIKLIHLLFQSDSHLD